MTKSLLRLLSRSGPELLLAAPTLARNLLSDHAPQYSLDFHFPAPMIPFIFVAAMEIVPVLGQYTGQWHLARQELSGAGFLGATGYRRFSLEFVNPGFQVLDFRVAATGKTPLWIDKIQVIPSAPLIEFARQLANY